MVLETLDKEDQFCFWNNSKDLTQYPMKTIFIHFRGRTPGPFVHKARETGSLHLLKMTGKLHPCDRNNIGVSKQDLENIPPKDKLKMKGKSHAWTKSFIRK